MVAGAGREERGGEGLERREGTRLCVCVDVCVGEGVGGGSPKMKNLMKAARRRTMESWPRRKPWVKERLWRGLVVSRGEVRRVSWGDERGLRRGSVCLRI